LTLSLLNSQVQAFAAEFSQVVATKLEHARELSREGKTDDAYKEISELQSNKTWAMIENPLRAQILRFQASIVLNNEKNIGKAKDLRDQAAQLDPTGDDVALRAIIRYFAEGKEAALRELPAPANINTFNLKLGFLIESGRADDALALLNQLPVGIEADAETLRLHALLLLLKGDQAGALEKVENASEQKPHWLSVRHAYGIVNYFTAISLAAWPKGIISRPSPVPWALVKRDHQSQQRLKEAESLFAQLAAEARDRQEQADGFNLWRLACLANDVDRQEEAADFCRRRLAVTPADSHTLAWALSRNYDVDLQSMEESLERVLGVDQGDDGD